MANIVIEEDQVAKQYSALHQRWGEPYLSLMIKLQLQMLSKRLKKLSGYTHEQEDFARRKISSIYHALDQGSSFSVVGKTGTDGISISAGTREFWDFMNDEIVIIEMQKRVSDEKIPMLHEHCPICRVTNIHASDPSTPIVNLPVKKRGKPLPIDPRTRVDLSEKSSKSKPIVKSPAVWIRGLPSLRKKIKSSTSTQKATLPPDTHTRVELSAAPTPRPVVRFPPGSGRVVRFPPVLGQVLPIVPDTKSTITFDDATSANRPIVNLPPAEPSQKAAASEEDLISFE